MIYHYNSIRFREPRMEDAVQMQKWLNESAEMKRALGGWIDDLITLEGEQLYLRRQIDGKGDDRYFCIENASGSLIGSCSIFDWDKRCQKCTIGIFIGDAAARGKGHGGDALELLLLVAFTELNCRKVKLAVFSYNKPAIRLYEKKGFVREGVLSSEIFTGGAWHDEYLYALFRDRWTERIKKEGRRERI